MYYKIINVFEIRLLIIVWCISHRICANNVYRITICLIISALKWKIRSKIVSYMTNCCNVLSAMRDTL